MHRDLLSLILEFEWDDGNYFKSLHKHDVSAKEAEEIFLNRPLIVAEDPKHSRHEKRYGAYGITDEGRRLFASFTIRRKKIRVISARPMDRQERKIYEQEKA